MPQLDAFLRQPLHETVRLDEAWGSLAELLDEDVA
jgi:hypothetical protein